MAKAKTKQRESGTPKLEPLHVVLESKPLKKGDVVTIQVGDDYPTRYNTASSIAKQAAELMGSLKSAILPDALERFLDINGTNPFEPVSSIAYQDPDGNVLRVSFPIKYKEVPVEALEKLFASIRRRPQDEEEEEKPVDINDYIQRTVVGTFDSGAFQGSDGAFDKKRYDAIMGAMEEVAKKFGIANPLTTQETIKPLPRFHTQRWVDFDIATNRRISTVMPNQTQFSPCPNVVTGKMAGEPEPTETKNE